MSMYPASQRLVAAPERQRILARANDAFRKAEGRCTMRRVSRHASRDRQVNQICTRPLELRKRHPASNSTPIPEFKGNRHEKDQMEPMRVRISPEASGVQELECTGVG